MYAHEIVRAVLARSIQPTEVLKFFQERIASRDAELHAFLSVNPSAVIEAEALERRLDKGEMPALAGVPVALKDNLNVRGMKTTCASRSLEHYVSPYDAHVVERLRSAGAIVLGKTNLDEFAMGSSTEFSCFGPTKNPWNIGCVPGGTSGGSAAAVASGMAPLALGSDTGGSVRQPAALTGTLGFKPTYGRVSRFGLVAFASSLDQIGPLALCTRDLAMLMDVIAEYDLRDATSLNTPPHFVEGLSKPVRGLRLGVVRETMTSGNTPGVEQAVQGFIGEIRVLGVEVREVSIPSLRYALPAYYLVAMSEASSNLARYDGTLYSHRAQGDELVENTMDSRSESFGREVKRRVLMGTFALSSGYYDAYYGKALRARTLLLADFDRALSEVDVLLMPTSPVPAFRFGERTGDPLSMYLADIDTVAANLTGLPALSIPAGYEGGLPVAVQLMGRTGQDERLFAVSEAFEHSTEAAYLKVAPH